MGLNQEQVAVGFGDEVALQQVSHGCGMWVMEGAVADIGVPGGLHHGVGDAVGGTSFLGVPTTRFDQVLAEVTRGHVCETLANTEYVACRCSGGMASFPTLEFNVITMVAGTDGSVPAVEVLDAAGLRAAALSMEASGAGALVAGHGGGCGEIPVPGREKVGGRVNTPHSP